MKKLTNIKLLEIDQLSPINKIRKVIQILERSNRWVSVGFKTEL